MYHIISYYPTLTSAELNKAVSMKSVIFSWWKTHLGQRHLSAIFFWIIEGLFQNFTSTCCRAWQANAKLLSHANYDWVWKLFLSFSFWHTYGFCFYPNIMFRITCLLVANASSGWYEPQPRTNSKPQIWTLEN